MRHPHEVIWSGWLVVLSVAGCVPYTVATTAQPVPVGEVAPTLVWYSIPNGIEVMRDSSIAWLGIDAETRLGVSDRADVGIRIPSASGVVVTYKYRLSTNRDRQAPAIAVMGGGGLVNWGNHADFELTLIASGRQKLLTPYGGLRVGQVLPLSREAASDSPETAHALRRPARGTGLAVVTRSSVGFTNCGWVLGTSDRQGAAGRERRGRRILRPFGARRAIVTGHCCASIGAARRGSDQRNHADNRRPPALAFLRADARRAEPSRYLQSD